jgi:hypothetical protein
MARRAFPSKSHWAHGAVHGGYDMDSLWAINQRLANTERELEVQFTRIAQLQAQLDVLLAALRRSSGGALI